MDYLDMYIVGVGGQGVLTIAEIALEAASKKDIPANFYPTKGMAQRGGFVKAQVRFGRTLYGPSIPEQGADVLASMELSESLKAVRYAKKGADFVILNSRWEPAAVMLGKSPYPGEDTVVSEVEKAGARAHLLSTSPLPLFQGEPIFENLYLLGAMIRRSGLSALFSLEEIAAVVRERWPKVAEKNIFTLRAGYDAAAAGKPNGT
ncbi:MAG: 2-oxoacid:acceptor oxidoreductase family protein [Spirochaetaceae bacterium]|jgi:indolepyruvate ferredoxin oxidoreductase beta subunit|nr:2-oxoacid:acceptor oxidoreductase family protein [Spirochaetaceae bacterium]